MLVKIYEQDSGVYLEVRRDVVSDVVICVGVSRVVVNVNYSISVVAFVLSIKQDEVVVTIYERVKEVKDFNFI